LHFRWQSKSSGKFWNLKDRVVQGLAQQKSCPAMPSHVISMPKLIVSGLLNQLRADLRGDTERGKLVRSAGMTVGMKIGATLLALGASLLYARALGPHDYGLYAYVVAWTAILTVPAGLGLPQYLVREGAKAPQSLSWLCRWADKRVLLAGLVVAALLACAMFIPAAAGARWLFVVAAPIPLLSNLTSVRNALLQAHGWIVSSQWPQALIAPSTMLIVLAAWWFWYGELRPIELISAMTACALLPLAISALQFRRVTSANDTKPRSVARLRGALPFMLLGGLYLLNNRIDIIMLGAIDGARNAGIYAIASRIAILTTFVAVAANTAIAPRIAQLYYAGDIALLQRLLYGAAKRYAAITAIVAAFLIGAAPPLIHFLYGVDFISAALPLQILTAGYFIQVVLGSTGTLLMMTGNERHSAYGLSIAVIINVVLNAALIPPYGVIGASAATTISTVLTQALLWSIAKRRLGLDSSAIGAYIR
jgi:O-antigen/teichoic acid export membrane protein